MGLLDALNSASLGLHRLWLFESTRVSNHLLAIACHLADVGAVSFILWLFESREVMMLLLRGSMACVSIAEWAIRTARLNQFIPLLPIFMN
jgi:NADH:ubiquinone oxidoreductase subunit D